MWHFANLQFASQDFCRLKCLRDCLYILFLHTNIANTNLYKIKKILFKRRLLGLFWDRVLPYFAEICGFVICRLAHLRNFRISDSGISPRICRFGICRLKKSCLSTSDRIFRMYKLCGSTQYVNGSDQQEVRGVGKVVNKKHMPWTVVINFFYCWFGCHFQKIIFPSLLTPAKLLY